ncbi:MAG: RNA methyltransferase [Acidobacteriota bacterium]|nr:RNA methyltransferase [Blastocatellia bacterium]MDW8240841.1 RNA methyltransferase [Acidobacteriota bacterium]
MDLSRSKIILVRPRDPNNIGAVARAMKNFGFTQLVIVAPHPPVWDEVVSAVHADDILKEAPVVASLAEAVADCTWVVGTTDRRRVEPKQTLYTPADLCRDVRQSEHRLALVFGPEKHGLTNNDLSHCHRVMSIPTQPDCPSMNLGQAVAICCYELTRDQPVPLQTKQQVEWATAGQIETAVQLMLDVLCLSEFIQPARRPDFALKLRRYLMRLNMTRRDVNTLCGALSKIKEKLVHRPVSSPVQD